MGSDDFYPEESPAHTVSVAGFAIERHPVTNAQFARFVDDTGYVTIAEKPLDAADFPDVPPEERAPGALVFRPTAGPVDLRNWRAWWTWVPGACWRHPTGPDASIADRGEHPVVQIAYPDANAYAQWADRRLPTETEWEYAARAGSTTVYPWGDTVQVNGKLMANTWQGRFPYRNDGADGWTGTSPVGTFAANPFGLVDMIGNVWEWTTTHYQPRHRPGHPAKACCTPALSANPAVMQTLKGGSHLCAPEYCHRYRAAARSSQSQDTATSHIGFRCVA
jgi:formylglycine-generating enzyme required for sulfatase activity